MGVLVTDRDICMNCAKCSVERTKSTVHDKVDHVLYVASVFFIGLAYLLASPRKDRSLHLTFFNFTVIIKDVFLFISHEICFHAPGTSVMNWCLGG